MIGIQLRGIKGINEALKRKDKALTQGVSKAVETSVININKEQVRRAPIDMGTLRQRTTWAKMGELDFRMISDTEYAPFQEFGTGGLVDIPAGLEAYASKFKGKGIRQVNMRPQPFFFAPFFEGRKKLIEQIKKLLAQ